MINAILFNVYSAYEYIFSNYIYNFVYYNYNIRIIYVLIA